MWGKSGPKGGDNVIVGWVGLFDWFWLGWFELAWVLVWIGWVGLRVGLGWVGALAGWVVRVGVGGVGVGWGVGGVGGGAGLVVGVGWGWVGLLVGSGHWLGWVTCWVLGWVAGWVGLVAWVGLGRLSWFGLNWFGFVRGGGQASACGVAVPLQEGSAVRAGQAEPKAGDICRGTPPEDAGLYGPLGGAAGGAVRGVLQ